MKIITVFFVFVFLCFAFTQLRGQEDAGSLKWGYSDKNTININDSLGTRLQDNKKAVGVIIYKVDKEGGFSNCTASFVNSVNQGGKYYLLTSAHCLKDKRDKEFIYNEKDTFKPFLMLNHEIMNPEEIIDETAEEKYSNATLTVKKIVEEQDIALLKLDINSVSEELRKELNNVYFSGWSIDYLSSPLFSIIAHPRGDVKKVYPIEKSSIVDKKTALEKEYFDIKKYTRDNMINEQGMSGAPVLNEQRQAMAVFNTGPVIDEKEKEEKIRKGEKIKPLPATANTIHSAWNTQGSGDKLLEQYLDPDNTYVSSIPGGYGLAKKGYKIDDSQFNYTLNANDSVSGELTVDLSALGIGLSRINSQEIAVFKPKGNFNPLNKTKLIRMTVTVLEQRIDTVALNETEIYSASFKLGGGFPSIFPEQSLEISNRISEIKKKFGYDKKTNLKIRIKLTNTTNSHLSLRAVYIPGLGGYRNAKQLFDPDGFKALYRNANYPESRGLNSSTYIDSLHIKVTDKRGNLVGQEHFKTNNNGGYVNLIQHEFPHFPSEGKVEITLKSSSNNGNHVSAWIDYDKNYNFNPGARTQNKVIDNVSSEEDTIRLEFNIPKVSSPITTRFRIALSSGSAPPDNGAGSYAVGEVEDYTVIIKPKRKDDNKQLLSASQQQTAAVQVGYLRREAQGQLQCASSSDGKSVSWKSCQDYKGVTNYGLCSKVIFSKDSEQTERYYVKIGKEYLGVSSSESKEISYGIYEKVVSHDLKWFDSPQPLRIYKLPEIESGKDYYAFQSSTGELSLFYELVKIVDDSKKTTDNPNSTIDGDSSVYDSASHKHLIIGLGVGIPSAGILLGGSALMIQKYGSALRRGYQRLNNSESSSGEMEMTNKEHCD